MTGFVRGVGVIALALAAACSRGGSGGNAGSSGSAGSDGATRSADGVVASVSEGAVKVKTHDGRMLDFPMKDDVRVTLAGGEASSAIVTEGAPVRVSFKDGGKGNELVSIDVEPGASGGAGTAPTQGASPGSAGAATTPPAGASSPQQPPGGK